MATYLEIGFHGLWLFYLVNIKKCLFVDEQFWINESILKERSGEGRY